VAGLDVLFFILRFLRERASVDVGWGRMAMNLIGEGHQHNRFWIEQQKL
jgi:hypothetical protein